MRLLKNLKKAYRRIRKEIRRIFKVSAFAIILDEQQHVLMCHRRGVDLWNLPGGGVEQGETSAQAVVREVKEETGLKVVARRRAGIYVNPARAYIAFSYICEVVGGKMKTSDETDDLKYFAFEKIPRYTPPDHVERIWDVLNHPYWFFLRVQYGSSAKKLLKRGEL